MRQSQKGRSPTTAKRSRTGSVRLPRQAPDVASGGARAARPRRTASSAGTDQQPEESGSRERDLAEVNPDRHAISYPLRRNSLPRPGSICSSRSS